MTKTPTIKSINVPAIRKGLKKVPKEEAFKHAVQVLKKALANYEKSKDGPARENLKKSIMVAVANLQKRL